MAAADLQRRALKRVMDRTHTRLGASRESAAALVKTISEIRARFNAELDQVLFDLAAMEGELSRALIDTATLEEPQPAPRKRKPRAETPPAQAEAPAPAPRRPLDRKRAAANDLDELPFAQPERKLA